MKNLLHIFLVLTSVITFPFSAMSQEVVLVGEGVGEPKSGNLKADILLMWSVAGPVSDRDWVTATDSSVKAAERVFNTIKLIGVHQDELGKILMLDKRADKYGYYLPFWPTKKGTLPIRIDTGSYGWQFNIYFDQDKKVSKVERLWIH